MKYILPNFIVFALGLSIASAAPTKAAPKPDRELVSAQKAVAELSATKKDKLLSLVNAGKATELVAVRGIGKARAAAVVKARPFKSLDEVTKVKGIGDAVFANLLKHGTKAAPKSSKSTSSKSAPAEKMPEKK